MKQHTESMRTDILVNDADWLAAASFVRSCGASSSEILAPSEFGPFVPSISYEARGRCPAPRVIVLHMGQLELLGRDWILAATKEMYPSFASRTFVVFTDTAMSASVLHSAEFKDFVVELKRMKAKSDRDRRMLHDMLGSMVPLTRANGAPNHNHLWSVLKELNAIKWSLKQHGYNISRAVYEKLSEMPVPLEPSRISLKSKCSTQEDLETDWFVYWMSQLKLAPLTHRKLWEFAYILQTLYQVGLMENGRSAIGFGCGEEPLPSYFASRGISVTVTDLEPEAVAGKGWAETGQHTAALESSYKQGLVSRATFDKNVSLRYVDMNHIPADLFGSYDFCWSVCALEHLGSIKNGLYFIRNSLSVLKPGGLAIHTTEFNYTETDHTTDNWPTVLFLRKHFEEVAADLLREGHHVFPLDFDVGAKPLDAFVDLPPYDFPSLLSHSPGSEGNDAFRPGHLKLSVDGFPATCFGFAVKKAET